jgi:hypothetical protein
LWYQAFPISLYLSLCVCVRVCVRACVCGFSLPSSHYVYLYQIFIDQCCLDSCVRTLSMKFLCLSITFSSHLCPRRDQCDKCYTSRKETCNARCFANKVVCQQLLFNTLWSECQWKEDTNIFFNYPSSPTNAEHITFEICTVLK